MDKNMASSKLLFDTHVHLDDENYADEERSDVMDRIEASPVAYVVDVGFDIESSKRTMKNALDRPWCFAAVGVHPHEADAFTDEDLKSLRELAGMPKVVAIGEIGLDFHRDYSPRDKQRYAYRKQLALALDMGLPIIIHDRESAGETLEILKDEGAFSAERKAAFPKNPETGRPDVRVLFHCFAGSTELAMEYINLGCTISIAGPVTYKNNKKTVLVVAEVPLAHLVIETDSPYMTPEPLRGRTNEPAYVEHVARKIAELRGITYEDVAAATLANAKRFFGI